MPGSFSSYRIRIQEWGKEGDIGNLGMLDIIVLVVNFLPIQIPPTIFNYLQSSTIRQAQLPEWFDVCENPSLTSNAEI